MIETKAQILTNPHKEMENWAKYFKQLVSDIGQGTVPDCVVLEWRKQNLKAYDHPGLLPQGNWRACGTVRRNLHKAQWLSWDEMKITFRETSLAESLGAESWKKSSSNLQRGFPQICTVRNEKGVLQEEGSEDTRCKLDQYERVKSF